MSSASRAALIAVTFSAGVAGLHCTSLLGDFDLASSDADSGPSSDATTDTSPHPGTDGGTDASDAAPSNDAAPDGGCNGTCTPAVCQSGTLSCDGGAPVCTPTGNSLDGTTCDAGAVCNKGACSACAAGTDCTPQGSCLKKTNVCTSGSPVCTDNGNVQDGLPCGTNLYCNGGKCEPCTNGNGCTPPTAPCNKGSVVCSGGTASCTDTGSPANDGTSCGTNLVCKGGACVTCTAGTSCNPNNDPCHVGQTSCATGVQTCDPTGNAPDTTPCGTNMACKSGACVCAAGTTTCGGACVDLTTDKGNCGRCGHDCLKGTCSASACKAWNIQNISGNTFFAADANYVVFADNGSGTGNNIREVKTSGGTPLTPMPPIGPQPYNGPVLANGKVAWVAGATQVAWAPEGVAPGTIAGTISGSPAPTLTAIALNPAATSAYVVSQSNAAAPYPMTLFNCPLGGGGCASVAVIESPGSQDYDIPRLLISTTNAYWIYVNGPQGKFSINSLTLANNAISTVNVVGPQQNFAMDATSLYYSASPAFTVYKLPLAFTSTTVPTPVTTNGSSIVGLSSDGTNVYFGEYGGTGRANVYAVPTSGGTATPIFTSAIAGSQTGPVAAAGGVIYFAEEDINNDVFALWAVAAP